MIILSTHRIFISHAWTYGDSYTKLVGLLNGADNFSYVNYSAPEDRPIEFNKNPPPKKEIKAKITNKINLVPTVVVLSGMYVAYSEWMQYELDEAVRLGKRIVGVKPRGQERIPTAVSNVADIMVGWNTKSIVDAIKGK